VVVLVQRLSLGVVLLVPLPQQPMATYHRKETQIKPLSSFKTSRLPPKLVKLERKKNRTLPTGAVVPVPRERTVEVGDDLRKW
jgi:hypothetical protein